MSYFAKYETPDYIHGELDRFTSPDIADLLMGDPNPIIESFGYGFLTGLGIPVSTSVIVGLNGPNDDSIDEVLGLVQGMHELGYRTISDLMQGIIEEGYSQDELISVSKRIMQDILDYFRTGDNPKDLNQILRSTKPMWPNSET